MRLAQASLILFLLCFSCVALAQVKNVNPKVNIIGGETYYVHTVLAGQEIEAIAKAYYTDSKVIANENPEAITGLSEGMKLRIPCTLESFDAMSKLKVKNNQETEQVAESRPPEPVAQANRNKKTQVTPIQEAISLMDEPKVEEEPKPASKPEDAAVVQPPEPEPEPQLEVVPPPAPAVVVPEQPELETVQPVEVLADDAPDDDGLPANEEEGLEDLSKSITESLEALKKIREQLEAPAPAVKDQFTPSDIPASSRINELLFLEDLMSKHFEPDSSDTALHLKEYFFVQIDPQGVPRNIEDERTLTNENTQYISLDRLKEIRFEAMQENGLVGDKAAIGLTLDAHKHVYDLKIKKKRIRYYRTSFFVEHMKKDHPHFDLIRKAADSEGKLGKCHVVIYDGWMTETLHKRVEYNPFAEQVQVLSENRFIEIESIEFR